MGAGVFSGVYGDWWEYDPIADSWTEIASVFPNADQASATAIGNVGYLYNTGGGSGGGQQLYLYDATNNTWNADALLPGDRIANAAMFTSGDHGYLVFGDRSTSGGNFSSNALWRITPGATSVPEIGPFDLRIVAMRGSISIRSERMLDASGTVQLHDARGAASTLRAGALNVDTGTALVPGLYVVQVRAGDKFESTRVLLAP